MFEISMSWKIFNDSISLTATGPKPNSCHVTLADRQQCLASMDSDLEAFSRNPTDDSFAVIPFQVAAFTKYLNEVFLSY